MTLSPIDDRGSERRGWRFSLAFLLLFVLSGCASEAPSPDTLVGEVDASSWDGAGADGDALEPKDSGDSDGDSLSDGGDGDGDSLSDGDSDSLGDGDSDSLSDGDGNGDTGADVEVAGELPNPPPSCNATPLTMLSIGSPETDTTVGAPNSVTTDRTSCQDDAALWGEGLGDRQFGFVPDETGTYRFDIAADFNAALTVTTGCPTSVVQGCHRWSRPKYPTAPHGVEAALEAGQLYVITVDAAFDSPPVQPNLYSAAWGVEFVDRVHDEAIVFLKNLLMLMRDLAATSGGDELLHSHRVALNAEFQLSMDHIDLFANAATLGGHHFLDGTAGDGAGLVNFWIGSVEPFGGAMTFGAQDTAGLGLTGAAIETLASAQSAVDAVDAAIDAISSDGSDMVARRLLLEAVLARQQGTFSLSVQGPCVGDCPSSECVPDCSNSECGSDGCDGVCEVCPYDSICDAGTCQAVPNCPLQTEVLACGTTSVGHSHTLLSAADEVQFVINAPNQPQRMNIRMAGVFGTNMWMFVRKDPTTSACVHFALDVAGEGRGSVSFLAEPNHLYELVLFADHEVYGFLSNYGPQAFTDDIDSFAIEVECCLPDCAGKTCGDDGCGGSCGTCDYCTALGQCAQPPTANCLPDQPLVCGQTESGINLAGPLTMAPDGLSDHMHQAFSLTAAVDGPVTLTTDAPIWSLTQIRVLDMAGVTCVDAVTPIVMGLGFGEVTFNAVAGTSYRVLVEETWSHPEFERPDFSVTASCP